MALLQGVPGPGQRPYQPADNQQQSALALPFSLQPAAPIQPAAFNTFNGQPSGCKPAPYRAYPSTDPGLSLQSMASSSDDGLRVAEGCLRLLAI